MYGAEFGIIGSIIYLAAMLWLLCHYLSAPGRAARDNRIACRRFLRDPKKMSTLDFKRLGERAAAADAAAEAASQRRIILPGDPPPPRRNIEIILHIARS